MTQILQIVPQLPPSISGVGDYALILARALREHHDIHTMFAVANPETVIKSGSSGRESAPSDGPENQSRLTSAATGEGSWTLEGFPVIPLPHSAAALGGIAQNFNRVLLHYVGYGYENRGCPVWLVKGLSAWCKEQGAGHPSSVRRLVTMFHELFASGPPWTSAFWTHPLQRWLCRQLAHLSSHCVTNRTHSQQVLHGMRQSEDVQLLPVFSNVGELEQLPAPESRVRRLVVFGSEGWRRVAVTADSSALTECCHVFALDEVLEIGPGSVPRPSLKVPWRSLGVLPAAEISTWMRSSMAGFLSYPSHCLGKSTIFAAYAAHGLMPVLPGRCIGPDTDGLMEGVQFAASKHRASGAFELLRLIQTGAFTWYQRHRTAAQAGNFARCLEVKSRRS